VIYYNNKGSDLFHEIFTLRNNLIFNSLNIKKVLFKKVLLKY